MFRRYYHYSVGRGEARGQICVQRAHGRCDAGAREQKQPEGLGQNGVDGERGDIGGTVQAHYSDVNQVKCFLMVAR